MVGPSTLVVSPTVHTNISSSRKMSRLNEVRGHRAHLCQELIDTSWLECLTRITNMSPKSASFPPTSELYELVDAFFENAKFTEDANGRYIFTGKSGKPSKEAVYGLLGPNRTFSAEKSNWKSHTYKAKDPSLQVKTTEKLMRFFKGERLAGVIGDGFEEKYATLRANWEEEYGSPPSGALGELIRQLELYHLGLRRALAQSGKASAEQLVRTASMEFHHRPHRDVTSISTMGFVSPPHFIGRVEELRILTEKLTRGQRIVIVEGVAGVGKSSLVFRTISSLSQARAFERIVAISAREGNLSEEAFLDQICSGLSYPSMTQLVLEEKRDAVAALLKDERVLVFVDNFETCDPNCQQSILSYFLDQASSSLIVTSRSFPELGRTAMDCSFFLKLSGVSVEETEELVHSEAERLSLSLGPGQHEGEIQRLHEITGGNPLAIKFVIARLSRSAQPFSELLRSLETAEAGFFEELFGRSWDDLSVIARRAMIAAASFPAPFSEDAFSAGAGLEVAEARFALEELLGFAFIDRANSAFAENVRFQTHPLVAAFAVRRTSESEFEQAILRLATFFEGKAGGDDLVFWEGRNDYDHLEADYLNIVSVANDLWEHDLKLEFVRLAKSVADFFYAKGHWGTCLELGVKAAKVAQDLVERDLESWIRVHMTGHLFANRFNFSRASSEFKRAAQLAVASKNPAYESVALRNLGRILRKSGEVRAALKAYSRSRKLAASEGLSRELSLTLNELGKLARDAGRAERALCYFDRALVALDRFENSIAAGIQCNIGGVAVAIGDLTMAKTATESSYEFFAKVGNREGIASTKWRLALIAEAEEAGSGDHDAGEALEIFQRLGMSREAEAIQSTFKL